MPQDKQSTWEEELKRQCEIRNLPYSEIHYLVSEIVATLNADHQKLVLEAKKQGYEMGIEYAEGMAIHEGEKRERKRIVEILEGMKKNAKIVRTGGFFNGDTPVMFENDQKMTEFAIKALDEVLQALKSQSL